MVASISPSLRTGAATVATFSDRAAASNLEFPGGTLAASSISQAVDAHPILGKPPGTPLQAFATQYAPGNRFPPTAVPLKLTYIGATPLQSLRNVLASYLSRSSDTEVSLLRHDPRFDRLTEGDFVDLARHTTISLPCARIFMPASRRNLPSAKTFLWGAFPTIKHAGSTHQFRH
jgi:hypothetical protein